MSDPQPKQSASTALLTTLVCLLCIAQCTLTNLRDAVIVGSIPNGITAIPFIQVWLMVPCVLLMTSLFFRLSHRFGRRLACSAIVGGLLCYFLLFALVLFPNREALQLTTLSDGLRALLPTGLHGFAVMIEHWNLSLFFLSSEVWGVLPISMIFWGLVNEVTVAKSAEKKYGGLQAGATLSSLIAGFTANMLIAHTFDPHIPFGNSPWEQTIIKQVLLITVTGGSALILFQRLFLLVDAKGSNPTACGNRLSIREALQTIFHYRYLSGLTLFVAAHSFIFLTSDLIWKEHLRRAFTDPNDMMMVMNNAMWVCGLLSFTAALLIPRLVARWGWTFLALISPTLVALSTAAFFASLFFGETFARYHLFGITSASLFAVYTGAFQTCICKATRFSVGNVAKEIALTALPLRMKWTGKTAVDSVGNNLARASTAGVHQIMLLGLGSIAFAIPYLALLVVFFLFTWTGAAISTGDGYRTRVQRQQAQLSPKTAMQ